MGNLKERLLAVISDRSHTVGMWRSRYSQRRQGMGLFGLVADPRSATVLKGSRLAEENALLAEIGRIISSSLAIEEVYAQFSQEVSKLVPFDNINIVTVNQDQSNFTIRYHNGLVVPGRELGQPVPLAGSATERVVGACKGYLWQSENRAEIERSDPGRLPNFDAGLRSFLSVPLTFRDTVTGVLHLRSRKPNAYTDRDLALVERIGLQIAPALENARLYQETRKAEEAERLRSEELGVLFKVASILSEPGAFEHKVGRVTEELTHIAQAELCVFRVTESDGLRLVGNAGSFSPSMNLLPYEGNIPALMLEQGRPLIIDDYPDHPLASEHYLSRGVKSQLCAPVRSQGSVLGVVIVSSLEPDHFTPERVNLLMAIINGLGTLVESARLEERRKHTEQRLQETARLASIGELAAGVAHEINNPLTSVLGYSQMLLTSKLSSKLSKEVSGDIQTIYDEAQRAAKIVQNLLFFARRRNAEKQYLDLNSVLNRSLEMKSYDLKVSNIEVVSQLSPEIRKTMVDERQLVQVFLNILTNAEQAIYKTSGKGQIGVSTATSGDEIEITIKDDGPGIPSENLHGIFEPFFTTKEVGQGTGLGLSISYGIIKQHGGNIWAESVAGEGTTFHITLPVVIPEEISVFQLPTLASKSNTSKHLLVVDDEPHIRDLLRKHLELERYTVDLAEDGREAWRKIQVIKYDCIILDLKMPGMSGPELYQLIQGIGEPLASKVVFITGDTVSPETSSFLDSAGNPVLTKPFSILELEEEILRTMLRSDDSVAPTLPGGPVEH